MAEEIVTLAQFFDPMAAQLVKNRLEAEGIPVMLGGNTSGELFSGMGGSLGTVHIQVMERHLARAQAILAQSEEELDEDDPEPSTAIEERGTFRSAPGQEFPPAPTAIQPTPARPPVPPQVSPRGEEDLTAEPPGPTCVADDEDEDELAGQEITWTAETLARRAWRAAVIGLLIVPVSFYSIWLLFQLSDKGENLSEQAARHMYGAMLIDGLVCFFLLIVGMLMCAGMS